MGRQMWTERLALPRLPLCQVFVSLGARLCAFISAHAWLRLANHQVVRCDKALCHNCVNSAESHATYAPHLAISGISSLCQTLVTMDSAPGAQWQPKKNTVWNSDTFLFASPFHVLSLQTNWINWSILRQNQLYAMRIYPFSLHSTVHCVNFVGPGAGQSNVQSSEKVTSNDSKILVISNHFLIA